MCVVCGAVYAAGSRSGNQIPDPGSRNDSRAAHADLEKFGAATAITGVANEEDPI